MFAREGIENASKEKGKGVLGGVPASSKDWCGWVLCWPCYTMKHWRHQGGGMRKPTGSR